MEMVLLNNRFAVETWERNLLPDICPLDETDEISFVGSVSEIEKRIGSIPPASRPVVIAVQTKSERNHSSAFRCQIWSNPFPPHSIYRLPDSDVCVASPAFCYLQMAARLSLPEAIRLGMELCGTHSTLPFAPNIQRSTFGLTERERRNGFVSRNALLTADQLRAWIAQSGHPYSRAATAARYVLDNSRSPGETRLYILLCLPVRMGGYGLPRPELNVRIDLPAEYWAVAGSRYYVCDLYYPEKKLAIEYDGGYHWDDERREDDNLREALLKACGIQVIRIDKAQLSKPAVMDIQVHDIARELGIRVRPISEKTKLARKKLRRETLDWALNPYVVG